jgi:hypothetical protein
MSIVKNSYFRAPLCTDSDVIAFVVATGITDATIIIALCTLVSNAKTNGWWTACNAIYPFVGGTATTHKFNLKNPLDTNAAFRLSFIGGWTHSANGALPNGTNAYANTFIVPSSGLLTLYNTHLSYYSRTDINEASIDMGSYNTASGGNNLFALAMRKPISSSVQYDQSTLSNYAISSTITDTRGFFMGNRTSNVGNTHKIFRNGSVIGTASTTGGAFRNDAITIGAILTGFYSSKECAFATIGSGLSDALAAQMYADIQTFQTSLSRNV